MTQAERLIRNLCEERRLQLIESQKAALHQVPERHEWRKLPPRVQGLVIRYCQLEDEQDRVKASIGRAGYVVHYGLKRKKSLQLKDHAMRQAQVRSRYTLRLEAIQKLKTDATIAALGKSATEAQTILLGLQRALKKV